MKRNFLITLLIAMAMTISVHAQDVDKALMKEAKGGNVEAQIKVAQALMQKNENDKAAKWLYTATVSGNKEAEQLLLSFYSKELEKYAKEGNAEAQFVMGNFCLEGKGVKKDLKAAAKWYDSATAKNHKGAKKQLGSFYNDILVKRAEKQNDAEMQYCLGLCYLHGYEVEINKEDAAKWLEQAMLQGHKEAGQVFFSFESNLKSQRVKELVLNPMVTYKGYAIEGRDGYYNIAKSPVAEISIGKPGSYTSAVDLHTTYLTIKGEKDGDQMLNASIESEVMQFAFYGNVELKRNAEGGNGRYSTLNTDVILKEGGKFTSPGFSNYTLKRDLVFNIDVLNKNYSLKKGISRVIKDHKEHYEKICSYLNCSLYQNIYKAFSAVNQIEKIDSASTDFRMHLALVADPNTDRPCFSTYWKLKKDTLFLGGNALSWDQGKTTFKLETASADKSVTWNQSGDLLQFTKMFKDGIVHYHYAAGLEDVGKNRIIFNNGERFDGLFYLGFSGKQIAPQSSFQPEALKDVWAADNISNLPVTFFKGDYTDTKGLVEEWESGTPKYITEQYKVASKNVKEVRADLQESAKQRKLAGLNAKREVAVKQLIAEGFDKTDVEVLLYGCGIREGMSRKLIERANDLGSNLTIEMQCTLDGSPRSLVMIVNPENGEVNFHQFIGYNIVGLVSIIERMGD